jgi:UDP-N-acetylmuramoyl-tripeptide--D-alanyl-D-alanine ligase
MASLSLTQLQTVTEGMIDGTVKGHDLSFSAISTDTRTLQKGDLFVALKGPNFNGNEFVAIAAEKQACAALVSENVATTLPTVRVEDTRIALGQLGRHNRRLSTARVIALTGSQGKTTVKEMTAAILAQHGEVLSTQGNLNNDYGVPLTLLRMNPSHRYAVIEMGANALGEIAYTTALAEPDIAHITCVAPTHVEGFGSLEGVGRAKAEIWQGLGKHGVAVLNLDDENIMRNADKQAGGRIVSISAAGKAEADYRIDAWMDRGLDGSSFVLRTPRGKQDIQLPLPGRHNAANALAAAALAMEAGASLTQVAQGLAHMQSVKGRLNVKPGLHGSVILDDTYNASPASFKAAIDVLATQPGIRIVVAGDMGELGSLAQSGHREVGQYAKDKGIEHFYATGTLVREAVAAFGGNGIHAADCATLAQMLQPLLQRGVSVLVKGSRSAGMERVVQQLAAKPADQAGSHNKQDHGD